jgi:EAL domain-containing protein (putative c-di-GMP-specific phosphodiesterase class I)
LNLAENGRIYCSTLEGAVDYAEDSAAYADGRLQLMFGNLVTPNRALLVYRHATASGSVLVGIDGQHVFDVLSLGAEEFTVEIGIGPNWVGKEGTVTDAFRQPDNAIASLVPSTAYPFTVGVAYGQGLVWRHLGFDYWPSWLLLALLGLLSGYAARRFLSQRNSLTAELRRAVDADEFVPFYQPVVLGESGALAGAEVLVRWMHPIEGIIPPNQFIPLAESTGLIVKMTYQLMDRVQGELLGQLPNLPEPFHVGFNISAAHCTSMELLDRCRAFLEPFPPGSVILFLELTEREAIPATPMTDALFKQLDGMGVQVALDDFGTGNSSLEYLQRFTVNALKIDQSFVAKAGTETLSSHILDIIADLASRLELFVVAEGVENAMQREYLQKLGVEYMQGYLFGRPVPFAEFAATHLPPAAGGTGDGAPV